MLVFVNVKESTGSLQWTVPCGLNLYKYSFSLYNIVINTFKAHLLDVTD